MVDARRGAAAQINLYAMDVRHVQHLLPHQIRVWDEMVDSIVVSLDVHRSRSGRYRGADYARSLERLRQILADARASHPKLKVIEVDYSDEERRRVASTFFGLDSIPVKAWDGGPFYAYFHGLFAAGARYVMHFDGDLLFGGGSRTWLEEAIQLFEQHPDALLASPLPGPPRDDGRIFGHPDHDGSTVERLEAPSPAYRFNQASTRVFLIDTLRFQERVGRFPLLEPDPVKRFKAMLLGNPPQAREAEVILTETMRRHGLCRIDFLGAPPGLWSLHPPYRSEEFYARLPKIIDMVERGQMPEGQRGHYDLNDSVIDWSQARAAARWERRYLRHLRDRLSRPDAG